ncbi:MAG: response regulator [Chitinophagaceae bacterium]|nr:MAG: response regulator [Chitinophagaceae bacterium]
MIEMDKKKIYVADDDANILELMQLILEARGYEVITSADGRSLSRLTDLPDMIFLDIAMSGTDGGEICHSFKQQHRLNERPVVLVSANTNLREIADRCGADAVLAKPFDIKSVVELARRFTEKGNN